MLKTPTSSTPTARCVPGIPPPRPPFAGREVITVAASLVALLLALDFRHGYLRDELYFRLLRDHLNWGYFDQPPLVPLVAWMSTSVFGDTLWALRMPAALALGLFTVLIGLLARELGGGRGAQVLASTGAGTAPWPLGNGDMLVTNAFDLPVWIAAILFVVRALRRDGRWWLVAGLTGALATYNKHLIVLLAGSLLIGLVAVGPRRVLANRWMWLGVAIAAVVAAPNLIYQIAEGFPQLTMAGALADDRGPGFRALFVPMQFIMIGPFLAALCVPGWMRLFRDGRLRALAAAYPVCAVVVFVSGGRPDYFVGLLILLFVSGCVAVESRLARARWRRVLTGAVALNALFALTVAVPALPLNVLVNTPIPDFNAKIRDSVGWPRFAEQVARVYHGLTPRDRARAVLLVGNYGEAGALHRYGPRLGLPAAYSGHNELHRLGPPPEGATVAVLVGMSGVPKSEIFGHCAPSGQRVDNGVGMKNAEQGREIFVCRDLKAPWSRLWPRLRHSHHYG